MTTKRYFYFITTRLLLSKNNYFRINYCFSDWNWNLLSIPAGQPARASFDLCLQMDGVQSNPFIFWPFFCVCFFVISIPFSVKRKYFVDGNAYALNECLISRILLIGIELEKIQNDRNFVFINYRYVLFGF